MHWNIAARTQRLARSFHRQPTAETSYMVVSFWEALNLFWATTFRLLDYQRGSSPLISSLPLTNQQYDYLTLFFPNRDNKSHLIRLTSLRMRRFSTSKEDVRSEPGRSLTSEKTMNTSSHFKVDRPLGKPDLCALWWCPRNSKEFLYLGRYTYDFFFPRSYSIISDLPKSQEEDYNDTSAPLHQYNIINEHHSQRYSPDSTNDSNPVVSILRNFQTEDSLP